MKIQNCPECTKLYIKQKAKRKCPRTFFLTFLYDDQVAAICTVTVVQGQTKTTGTKQTSQNKPTDQRS